MKLCMSQYSHESMPDAKLESGSFSSFGDMTSQNFSLKRGTVINFGCLPQENRFNFQKMSFYVQIRSFPHKFAPPLPPHAVSNFQAKENFFIFKIF